MTNTDNIEIWKRCPGFEQQYDISNMGNIRSYYSAGGKINRQEVQRIMTPGCYDYLYVVLTKNIGKSKRYAVHILVAKAFVPNPDKKKFVLHLNNDKLDPRAINLKWGTASENQKSAYIDGLRKRPSGILNVKFIGNKNYNYG